MNLDWLNRFQPQMLALLRIVTALLFGEHGTQKLLHFPPMGGFGAGGGGAGGGDGGGGGGGPGGGMGTLFLIAGILEMFGSLAILVGFLTRPIAFLLAGEAAVVFWWMHVGMMGKGNVFPISNGGESAVLFCFSFLYLVVAGSGAWSLDNMLWGRKAAA
jgi:putative oxidoreductase